ncbi:hypothetical protein CBL_09926 [Carabus blaptoides fortunei]
MAAAKKSRKIGKKLWIMAAVRDNMHLTWLKSTIRVDILVLLYRATSQVVCSV